MLKVLNLSVRIGRSPKTTNSATDRHWNEYWINTKKENKDPAIANFFKTYKFTATKNR
ncbi:MAG: hypothetical protein KME11_19585 [Timaviella obliquedivisa GSE-PSE-MK23-08B]|nr:hypothetical protein [Timaviella obliquedivisa GSE-PSE-MK23-08B]